MTDELADELYERKGRGESYEEVIWRLIEQADGTRNKQSQPSSAPDQEAQGDSLEISQSDSMRERMEAQLAEKDVTGRPAAVEQVRREAIIYAWDRLREEGQMKPRDLANDVFGRYFENPDLGYSTTTGRYAGYQLWDNCIREVLRDMPGVHTGRTWSFRED